MPEQDALSTFDFSTVGGSGLFVKFEAGKPLTLRVLTTDPVVANVAYEDKDTGETTVTTKFSFIVYNFTAGKAQILSASPSIARKIGELHVDPDFGANIKKIDIKISPTGEKLKRKYDIQVLLQAKELTSDMVKEAQAINLDDKVEGDRMSLYEPPKTPLTDQAEEGPTAPTPGTPEDVVIEDIGDEPINLDDIPF